MQRLLLLLVLTLVAAQVHGAGPGQLIIVGGALDSGNSAVFQAFIERVPEDQPIALVGAASVAPSSSMASFAEALQEHGVNEARIMPIALAWRDDPDTDEDESTWRDNAHDPQEIARIREAGGIWFTGGDQGRITRVLIDDDGTPTPMLDTMRERLEAGIVIGGTSAGAAIMSDPMITGGDTLPVLLAGLKAVSARATALPLPPAPNVDDAGDNMLSMGTGLGFLPGVLVDQHFDARARLGRLVMALLTRPEDARVGLGIDEDTGVAIDLGTQQLQVLGGSSATLVDARDAALGTESVQGLRLSVLAPGARLDLGTLEITTPDWQHAADTKAHQDPALPIARGLAAQDPPARLPLGQMLTEALLANATTRALAYPTFVVDPAGNAAIEPEGVAYRFSQTPESRSYQGRNGDDEHFTVVDVGFAIERVQLTVEPAASAP